jgi:formylglycine-generating enzyme required for sulfatase activity
MLAPNTILQSRYRIIRLLGKGGMGAVYEAIDERLNCIVALKETLVGSNLEARQAFEREAALLANLRHRALPNVMDHFSEGDGQFLVMGYIPGYDLAELIELRGSPFEPTRVLRWAEELLGVLQYLHNRQPPILHRDIKPSNLKLTKEGEVFLLDFGLAKGAAGQMSTLKTSKSMRGFTPRFAALEQILNTGTDPRSDLYSLGATLYLLLTNVEPADAATRYAAVEEGHEDPLLSIEFVNPKVSSGVAAVIYRAMAVSRRHRPANASEMQNALRLAEDEAERQIPQEEYRRADSRREQQEKKLRQAEDERRLQEVETSRMDEDAARQQELAQKRLEEEAATLRAEEQKQQEERARREAERASRKLLVEKAEQSRIAKERARVAEETQREVAPPTETPFAPKTTFVPPAARVQSAESPSPHPVAKAPAQPVVMSSEPSPERSFVGAHAVSLSSGSATLSGRISAFLQSNRPVVIVAATITTIAVWLVMLLLLYGSAGQTGSRPQPPGSPTSVTNPGNKDSTPPPTPPRGMSYVPGGTFMMGRDKSDGGDDYESPAHQVSVKSFFIDIYEVTNEDYAKFVEATTRNPPSTWEGVYPKDAAHRPVTGVTWYDANDYARWVGKRLPTEEEWEFAARGTDGRRYPWGNDWRKGLANANGASKGMVNVEDCQDKSPSGALGMVGNAWEWTASTLSPYPGGILPVKVSGDLKVIRGGTSSSDQTQATTTYRRGWLARSEDDYGDTGFRCVKDITKRAR